METRDSELKEAILEFVKGNDNKITMAIMTKVSKIRTTINVSKKLASKKPSKSASPAHFPKKKEAALDQEQTKVPDLVKTKSKNL